jgi:hypothetical protein
VLVVLLVCAGCALVVDALLPATASQISLYSNLHTPGHE